MTNKKTVMEHLKNEALWAPEHSEAVGGEWKRGLVERFAPPKRIAIEMREERRQWVFAAAVAIPLMAVAIAVVFYFGFASPSVLSQGVKAAFNFDLPGIGITGGILFAIVVNLVTFLFRSDLQELF